MSLVIGQVQGHTGVVTLDHAAKRNILSRDLIEELIGTLGEMKAASVRSVILRAQPGATVWSAGHDVTELPVSGRDPLSYDDPLRRVVRAIEALPLPVIAMIEGSVWGGACELAMTCDLAVAAPEVTFAFTPTRIGVPYNTAGIVNMMKSIGMPLLKEMLFTARPIPAERALRLGMINDVVPREDLERFTMQMADLIAETSPICVALMKEELRILSKSLPMSAETFERLQGLRQKVYDSRDYREGIRSFLEKRRPEFKGE